MQRQNSSVKQPTSRNGFNRCKKNSVNFWAARFPLLPKQLQHPRSASSVLRPEPRCEQPKRPGGRRSKGRRRPHQLNRRRNRKGNSAPKQLQIFVPGLQGEWLLKANRFNRPSGSSVRPGELRFLLRPQRGGPSLELRARRSCNSWFLVEAQCSVMGVAPFCLK